MSQSYSRKRPVSGVTRWFRGLWVFYRGYTDTPIHAASTAALAAFGLLAFVDRLFVVVAIASYVLPPLVLYSIGSSAGKETDSSRETALAERDTDSDGTDGDTDSDETDGDRDSDGDDGDTDSDGDDGDSDSDG